jgi:anhydro-N-acetylmuramic acid kinase
MKSNYIIIGIMSGTSLDGIDITCTEYIWEENTWRFELLFCKTYNYSDKDSATLKNATQLSAAELIQLDKKLGKLFGESVLLFLEEFSINKKNIDAIASHGHTIFHQPEKGFTYQIGCGTNISLVTNLPVINDFRTKDVLLGGQGAPLVPVGDFQLFRSIADGFLNIGGITNISYFRKQKIHAYDICPGNLPLNLLINTIGKPYDNQGEIAASGKVNIPLLETLNDLDFYKQNPPKSLGIEWIHACFSPVLDDCNDSIANKLATICEHIGMQIGKITTQQKIKKLLITGGGAHNKHLISCISANFNGQIIIPNNKIIEFKEAIIFGFLGALYLEKQANCLQDVTGAIRNSCSGVLHLPN